MRLATRTVCYRPSSESIINDSVRRKKGKKFFGQNVDTMSNDARIMTRESVNRSPPVGRAEPLSRSIRFDSSAVKIGPFRRHQQRRGSEGKEESVDCLGQDRGRRTRQQPDPKNGVDGEVTDDERAPLSGRQQDG